MPIDDALENISEEKKVQVSKLRDELSDYVGKDIIVMVSIPESKEGKTIIGIYKNTVLIGTSCFLVLENAVHYSELTWTRNPQEHKVVIVPTPRSSTQKIHSEKGLVNLKSIYYLGLNYKPDYGEE